MRRTVHDAEVRACSLVVMNVSDADTGFVIHVSVRPQPRSVSIRPFAVRSSDPACRQHVSHLDGGLIQYGSNLYLHGGTASNANDGDGAVAPRSMPSLTGTGLTSHGDGAGTRSAVVLYCGAVRTAV